MVAVVGVNRHTAAEDFIRAKFIGLQISALLSRKYFFIIHNFLPIFISLFLLLLFRTFDNETSETKIDDGSYRDLGYGGSLAELLACWTRAQKDPGSNRSRDAVGEQS